VETSLDFKPFEGFEMRGSYTYTNAMNTLTNAELLRRPQNKVALDADWRLGRVEIGTTVSYTGSRADYDFSGSRTILMPYFLAGLRASYELSPRVKFFARVENLFDQSYEEIYGYGTAGFSAFGGTKISF
jgi:vitamin B12 transporter